MVVDILFAFQAYVMFAVVSEKLTLFCTIAYLGFKANMLMICSSVLKAVGHCLGLLELGLFSASVVKEEALKSSRPPPEVHCH